MKEKLLKSVDKNKDTAFNLNYYLADNPEISGEEYNSCKKIVEILRDKNIEVKENFCGYETSFIGHVIEKNSDINIAIITEYDALSGIGHACGHSASAAISVLSALAIKDNENIINANVDIIGTPNEELDGLKNPMSKMGVFDKYNMAIMIHMSNRNIPCWRFLALETYEFTFNGTPAHAAMSPWEGRSALDGLMLMIHSLDLIRKHTYPDTIIEGFIKEGGLATNIIPEKAVGVYAFRSNSYSYLEKELVPWVFKAAKSSAKAMENTVDIKEYGYPFLDMNFNNTGVESIKEVMNELNISYENMEKAEGSSDMGSISYRCPSFHPSVKVGDEKVELHTRKMADLMKSEDVKESIVNGANIITLFIEKIINNEKLRNEILEEFKNSIMD